MSMVSMAMTKLRVIVGMVATLWRVRERKVRFLEGRLWPATTLLIMFFLVTSDLAVKTMSGISGSIGNSLDNASQTITVLDVLVHMLRSMFRDSLLLFEDKPFQFPKLGAKIIELKEVFFNIKLGESRIVANRLEALGVRIGNNMSWDR
jgi:hypothetical protein